MGCASSKRVEATVAADTYRPPPASFAVFDITSIDEPWLNSIHSQEVEKLDMLPYRVPMPLLHKLDKLDQVAEAPHYSWSEVSKALEDLKPALLRQALAKPSPESDTMQTAKQPTEIIITPPKEDVPAEKSLKKNRSYRTLEELEAKLSNKLATSPTDPKHDSKPPPATTAAPPPDVARFNSLKDNFFVVRDRLERQKDNGAKPTRAPRDPLSGYPEKCPPGGAAAVVLYTTTLRGVRRTFEDCQRARQVIDAHGKEVDERDVALHGQYLSELRELLGEDATVPRLFVKGRYVGGVDQVVELNESGRLRAVLGSVAGGKGPGRRDCDGCGGLRFVLCFDCNGSCKVLDGDNKGGTVRCTKCNENGLVYCPLCH